MTEQTRSTFCISCGNDEAYFIPIHLVDSGDKEWGTCLQCTKDDISIMLIKKENK